MHRLLLRYFIARARGTGRAHAELSRRGRYSLLANDARVALPRVRFSRETISRPPVGFRPASICFPAYGQSRCSREHCFLARCKMATSPRHAASYRYYRPARALDTLAAIDFASPPAFSLSSDVIVADSYHADICKISLHFISISGSIYHTAYIINIQRDMSSPNNVFVPGAHFLRRFHTARHIYVTTPRINAMLTQLA